MYACPSPCACHAVFHCVGVVLTCIGGCSEVWRGGVVNDGGRVMTCDPYLWAWVQVRWWDLSLLRHRKQQKDYKICDLELKIVHFKKHFELAFESVGLYAFSWMKLVSELCPQLPLAILNDMTHFMNLQFNHSTIRMYQSSRPFKVSYKDLQTH